MPRKGDNPITPIFLFIVLLDCCFSSVSYATAPHPSTSRPKVSPIKFIQKPGSSTKPFEDRGNVFMESQEAVKTENQEPPSSSNAILGIGLALISLTLAAILIDYCKHLKKTGVFHKIKKIEEIEALRRQALIASTEVSLGIAKRPSTNTVQQPLSLTELTEEPESEGEIQIHIPKSHHTNHSSGVDPQIDNQSETARLVTTANQKGLSSSSKNKRNSFLKQLSSRSVSSNGSRMSLKTKVVSTSNSINMQNQSVFMMKNYGTFDSDLELEFFNETAPHLETVTKHLPKKGKTLSMLLNKKPSFDEVTLISSPTTPTLNKTFDDDGSGSDMKTSIATTDALHRDSTRTLLTPPNYLAIYKKSSSDTNFFMSDLKFHTPSTSSFYDSSLSEAIDDDGTSVCVADRSENGKWSSMTTRLLQRELSSSLSTVAMKRTNNVKAHTPTASADRMHARLMQLYQDLPVSPRGNVRASSFSQVFESKKRLQSIEAQRRRKRAEALRKRKRRLQTKSNGSLTSPGFGGEGNKPQMMFISRMRVPLNKKDSISLFS